MRDGRLLSYTYVHARLRRLWRKPGRCFGCDKERRLDWALVADKYSFDVGDYLPICRSCHLRFDRGRGVVIEWAVKKPPR